MHCRNSTIRDPNFVPIGNADLIDKRHTRQVRCPPGGTLSDYVPFYFTPFTPMLLNIKTGFNGVRQRSLVSCPLPSLPFAAKVRDQQATENNELMCRS